VINDSIIGESGHTTSLSYVPVVVVSFISYEEIINCRSLVATHSMDNNFHATKILF